MSAVKHTPGPWELRPSYGNLCSEIVAGGRAIATVWTKQASTREEQKEPVAWPEGEANAALIVAAPELLSELQAAHQIILNALQIMTPKQKDAWAKANGDLIESGTTRFHERAAVIAKAQGQAS